MTLSEYLDHSTKVLKKADIPTARLDSLILIEYVTGIDRAKILANDGHKLSVKHKNVLNSLVSRRAQHTPVAQLTNAREFYGRNFYIDKNVMTPRPETEKMIDIFKSLYVSNKLLKKHKNLHIADIGTGSGVIGITIKKELPNLDVDLIDLDMKALKVAKSNVVLHTIDISVIHLDLIDSLSKPYHVLMCNLPYVPDEFPVNKEVLTEPSIAIFGGKDGLDVYRRLFSNLKKMKNKPLLILTESLPLSHTELSRVANLSGYRQVLNDDFIQVFEINENH